MPMRRYITERVGIVECFQIVVALIALGLAFYDKYHDLTWNRHVHQNGINICITINQKLNSSILQVVECTDRLDIKDSAYCEKYLNETYLKTRESKDKFTIMEDNKAKNKKNFIYSNMKREPASETTFVVCLTLVTIFLIGHLLLTHVVNDVNLRTRWNAALQGIVLFTCGFSAMLLSISLSSIDNKYLAVVNQLQMCGILRFCDRAYSSHPDLTKEIELTINDALSNFNACQDVKVKESACVLLLIMICMCLAMILLAMDLTTKYEQEVEEQLILQQEAENLDNLVENEMFVFESSADSSGALAAPPPPQEENTLSIRSRSGLHERRGSTILAEYLAANKAHSSGAVSENRR